ncbi:MAG: permease-like cell division protein FtsX [Defluviitaleaceae bacterium]|nr:permease-like cell division protein FtsX [Defluviitaleaceae bacterium]
MRLRSVQYSIGEALANLMRNRLMSVASIVTVAACVFMMSISYCLAANLDHILAQMEQTMTISVFVTSDATDGQVTELLNTLEKTPHVKDVKYKSAQEALDSMKAELSDSTGILNGLENDNPLPRSFTLDVDQISNIGPVAAQIIALNNPAIDKVNYGTDVTNTLMMINNVIRVIGLVMILGLAIISIVIITNTIRLAVNTRRTEINIMKYVGATDWFIRWPFVMEGVIIGVVGALVPMLFCWIGYSRVIGLIRDKVAILNLDYLSSLAIFTVLIPLSIALGIFIGAFGSLTSIRRHLNV